MKVTWDVRLEPLSRKDRQFSCEILVETADEILLAAIARQPPGAVDSVQAHCSRETPMFAADMERKALKRNLRPLSRFVAWCALQLDADCPQFQVADILQRMGR
jgi:hypothetical protein